MSARRSEESSRSNDSNACGDVAVASSTVDGPGPMPAPAPVPARVTAPAPAPALDDAPTDASVPRWAVMSGPSMAVISSKVAKTSESGRVGSSPSATCDVPGSREGLARSSTRNPSLLPPIALPCDPTIEGTTCAPLNRATFGGLDWATFGGLDWATFGGLEWRTCGELDWGTFGGLYAEGFGGLDGECFAVVMTFVGAAGALGA